MLPQRTHADGPNHGAALLVGDGPEAAPQVLSETQAVSDEIVALVEIKQKAQELPLVAQVLDVKLSEVPTRVKSKIINSLPEKQKEFTRYIFKQNVISPAQAMKDLNLKSKSQFEELDRSAAEAIQSNFATFHGPGQGQAGWRVEF